MEWPSNVMLLVCVSYFFKVNQCRSTCVCVGGSCVWMRECMRGSSHGECWDSSQDARRLSAAPRLQAYQASSRCPRSNRTSASLNALSLSWASAHPHTHTHTHALLHTTCRTGSPVCSAKPAPLSREGRVEIDAGSMPPQRHTRRERYVLFTGAVHYFPFQLWLCMSKSVRVHVDVKSLNGISEGLSGSRQRPRRALAESV